MQAKNESKNDGFNQKNTKELWKMQEMSRSGTTTKTTKPRDRQWPRYGGEISTVKMLECRQN